MYTKLQDCVLRPGGPPTNAVTAAQWGTIRRAYEDSGWTAAELTTGAREAMRPSQLVQDGMDLGEGTRLYLASTVLPETVWPYVTPMDDTSVVGEEADALALAMYRGHIDWDAVADAVYHLAQCQVVAAMHTEDAQPYQANDEFSMGLGEIDGGGQ